MLRGLWVCKIGAQATNHLKTRFFSYQVGYGPEAAIVSSGSQMQNACVGNGIAVNMRAVQYLKR